MSGAPHAAGLLAAPGRGWPPTPSDPETVETLVRRVRGLQLRANRLLDAGLAGTYRSVFRGRGIEAEGLREYTSDDDAALIDWAVSVRLQRPHLRVFREERELVCLLLVDGSPSMDCPVPGGVPRRTAAEVVALLALAASRNRDRVGLLLFSSVVELWLPPARSRGHALRLIRDVACHGRVGRGTSLAAGLQAALRLLPARALVFLVSDMLATLPDVDLARLARRHELIVLRLVPPEPDWTSLPGAVWLEDAETGDCRPVSPAGTLLADWRQQTEARDRSRQQAVRACGAEWVDLPCGPEAVTALAGYLSRRKGRRCLAPIPEVP